jgi:hypothetical protein
MKRQPMVDEEVKDNKKNKMDEDMENEDSQMEEEEKSCGTKKSQDLTEDDLSKAINVLNGFVTSADPISRKKALLNKAMTDDLSSDELDELVKSLDSSNTNDVTTVDDDFTSSISDSLETDTMQKALDVSDYLKELHDGLVKSLNSLENEFNGNASKQHTFNITLAKGIVSVGKGLVEMRDSISDLKKSIDSFGNEPVRKPTSVQPLNKAFVNQASQQNNTLTKSELMGQLLHLAEQGQDDIGGVSINHAVALLENSNQLPSHVVSALKAKQGATA